MTDRRPFPISTAVDTLVEVGDDDEAARWLLTMPPDEIYRTVAELIAQLRWMRDYSGD